MPKREWPAWANLSALFDLFRLASPIAVSRASMMLMGLTDTIVLSRNATGELPYILMAWFPMGIALGVSFGLLHGVSVLTAELSGRGEKHNTGRVFRRGLLISFGFGILATILIVLLARPLFTGFGFEGALLEGTISAAKYLALGVTAHMFSYTAANYLEALRRPTIVTIAMYGGVALNLALDLILVAGAFGFPKMGADGVALATSGTRWILGFVLLGLVAWFTPGFKRSAEAPTGEAKYQLQVGYGMAVSSVAEWGSFNFTHIIATWVSVFSSTVYGMIVQTIAFVFMAFMGLGSATSVRVAEQIGKNDPKAAQDAARIGILATFVLGIIASLILWVLSDQIASVFVSKDAVEEGFLIHPVLSLFIAVSALIIVFDGFQIVASMAVRAMGSVWPPSLIHIGSYFVVMLPLCYWLALPQERGLQGVIEGVIIASLIAGIFQFIFLEWYSRRLVKPTRESYGSNPRIEI